MKKLLVIALMLVASAGSVFGQSASVVYNYERNHFNENQPLPAETYFVLSGAIGSDISIVDVEIYRPRHKENAKPLFETVWKRPFKDQKEVFTLPVNYKLRNGNKYDFKITYYRSITDAEKEYIRLKLLQSLDSYLLGAVEVKKRSVRLLKPRRQIISDLNAIVSDGLINYRSRTELQFDGFSDVVRNKLEQIEDADLNKGKFLFQNGKKDARTQYANKLLQDLVAAVHTEAEQYLNTDLAATYDSKMVDDYPTERNKLTFSVNGGYGGVYFDGNFDDLDYDGAPFVGLSFPLGRKAFSPFWSNTSLSVGVFVTNMEDNDGNTITGPLIKRPFYVGLGYKVFKFIRLNAGATFLEKENKSGSDDLMIRPFVGASAEFNISISAGDK